MTSHGVHSKINIAQQFLCHTKSDMWYSYHQPYFNLGSSLQNSSINKELLGNFPHGETCTEVDKTWGTGLQSPGFAGPSLRFCPVLYHMFLHVVVSKVPCGFSPYFSMQQASAWICTKPFGLFYMSVRN